jgi:transposase
MSPYSTTPGTLIAALDIGKNVHWFGCYRYEGRLVAVVPPQKVRSDTVGFAQFAATVDRLLATSQYPAALLGNEHTGVYHEPWAWLIDAHYRPQLQPGAACPVTYRWLNPLLTKQRQAETTVRQRTSDRTAVVAIAACLADGLGHPAHLLTDPTAELRELVRSYDQVRGQLRFTGRQLLPQIDRLWPGAVADVKQFRRAHPDLPPPTPIVETHALDRDRLAVLLRYCPNPHAALALGAPGLIRLFHDHGYRAGPKTAETILTALRHSPLPPKPLAEVYARRLQADYGRYAALAAASQELETQIATGVPHTPARFVDSVPGIGPLLAASYLAPIGDAAYFPTASQVWALAGYDLRSAESGDAKQIGQITKRGSPALRDTLYQIGFHTASHCPPIGEVFLAARERGLSETAAVIHAAHKANRLCFSLLREARMYTPATPAEAAHFHQRGQRFQQQLAQQRQRQAHQHRLAT